MKMRLAVAALLLPAVLYTAASAGVITGKVVDTLANPVANATVSLKIKGSVVYTDVNGRFTINTDLSGTRRAPAADPGNLRVQAGEIRLATRSSEVLSVSLYTISGKRIGRPIDRTLGRGSHSIPVSSFISRSIGAGLIIVKVQKGSERLEFACLPMGSITAVSRCGTASGPRSPLGYTAAAADSLSAYRMSYRSAGLGLGDYATQDVGTIVLHKTAEEFAVEQKVDSVLALMTLSEKAGQMTQVQIPAAAGGQSRLTDAQVASNCIGSVFNGGSDAVVTGAGNTPAGLAGRIDSCISYNYINSRMKIPLIYGQDCVHGVSSMNGCTVFPHNIGLGCTHDTAAVAAMGRITASEASGCGVRLTFAPTVATCRNERWGRTYEGFGETSEINALMGCAFLRGLQGDGDISKDTAIAGDPKHFMGDGGTKDGANAGTTTLADSSMREIHFAQYVALARLNMATVMPSFSTWARPGGPSFKQTVDSIAQGRMLKKETGFDGFTVSDWDAVGSSDGYNAAGIAHAVNSGLDMAMATGQTNPTTWINAIVSGVQGGTIPQARVDDAVRRILRIKFRMHLWDHPKSTAAARSRIFSPEHQAVARKLVRESLVLLKNDTANGATVLPLKRTEKIAVVGSYANLLGAQCGGWTISWQGQTSGSGIAGQTILAALKTVNGDSTMVVFDQTGANLATINPDKIVVVVGEKPYAEGNGDNLNSLDFTNVNSAGTLITTCKNSGKPVICVMISGRPLLIDGELPNCKAFVAAWLPGSMGLGVADVLYGDYNFSGTLTHTWPATSDQIPINTGKYYAEEQHGSGGTPLFPYGYGLKY